MPTDKDDRPKQPITVQKVTVFVDPFDAARKANSAAREAAAGQASAAKVAAADPDRCAA